MKLTEKQGAVLAFIEAFTQKQGYSPTASEIAEHAGVSITAAQFYVRALERKGAIRRTPRIARSIVVI